MINCEKELSHNLHLRRTKNKIMPTLLQGKFWLKINLLISRRVKQQCDNVLSFALSANVFIEVFIFFKTFCWLLCDFGLIELCLAGSIYDSIFIQVLIKLISLFWKCIKTTKINLPSIYSKMLSIALEFM